jgi:hypothetical protein
MKRENVRSLDAIADNINKLERGSIIDIGDLLLEAKAQCDHGQWLGWLSAEFAWSVDSAERYMKVAELAVKFRRLRNLKLAVTTLYELADHEGEEDLPEIIAELAKHATKTPLRPRDTRRLISIGIGRSRFGDHPDATLVQLAELVASSAWYKKAVTPWYEKAVAALLEREPDTDESARLLVGEIAKEARSKGDAEEEVESILDGPPPDLPPPITPPEPQKFGANTEWEGRESFADSVTVLLGLRTKPVRRFVGRFSSSELREVSDFLLAIASDPDSTSASSASESAS